MNANDCSLLIRLPRYAAPSAVLRRSGLMRVAEARRMSQALVTAHITDTSWRSPSGVMLRASRVGQICRSAHCS